MLRVGQRRAMAALLMAGALLGWQGRQVVPAAVAQDAPPPGEPLLAFHVTSDSPVARTFAAGAAPAGGPGMPAPAAAPLSGQIEACVSTAGAGRILILFDDEGAVDTETPGCQTVDVVGASSVSLLAQGGDWDVVLRRPVAPAIPETGLATQVSARTPFGRTLSLMTAPNTPAGMPPQPAAAYSGAIEVCVSGAGSGVLMVLVDDEPSLRFTGAGCNQASVSEASSVTLLAQSGTWDTIVRRLP